MYKRQEQNGLKKTANQMGKGIIAFSPLAQGLLTDKYLHGIPSDSRIAVDGRFLHADALTKEKLAQIEALNKICLLYTSYYQAGTDGYFI